MKQIVIDARFWGTGHTGLGRYTQSLITAFERQKQKLKFEITLLANNLKLKTSFPVIKVNSRHYTFSEQFEIPKVLSRLQPNLVHFLHFNAPLFYQGQFIVTIHDLIKHYSFGLKTTTQLPFFYPIKRLGYHLSVKHSVLASRLILVPSQWVKKDILKFYPVKPQKIIITPEAADSYFFRPCSNSIPDLIPSQPYLIYVGNAYPHKNLIQLIKAVKIFRQKSNLNLQLVIVTAKDVFYQRLRHQLRKIQALDLVKIKGYSSDEQLKNLYHHSIAFITPSLLEGFGLPGLEAMASQTLVLSSNRTSLPEVYGPHAFYFNPDKINSIIQSIQQAINLNFKARSKKLIAGKNYASSFSWDKTAKLTLKAYENCLGL